MAFSVNKVTLLGNVTQDPELKYTPGGTAVLNINIATNRSIKDKSTDQWKDIATFHKVIVWGKLAEFISANVVKGDKVYVDGRIDNRSYEKDGQKRYITEVVAENVISMNKKGTQPAKTESAPGEPTTPENVQASDLDSSQPTDPSEEVKPDDIPF